jgi:signal transduction histidine kinase
MRLSIFILLCFCFQITYAQNKYKSLDTLSEKIIEFNNQKKDDSTLYALLSFCNRININKFEKQYGYYLLGIQYKKNNEKDKAINAFNESTKLKENTAESIELSGVNCLSLSDTYFTFKNFDSAFVYASKALPLLPKNVPKFCVDARSIIGYYFYDKKLYNQSLVQYENALVLSQNNKLFGADHLHNKIAKLYSKLKNEDKALFHIKQSMAFADTLKNLELKLIATKTLFDVYVNLNQANKAVALMDTIETLTLNFDKQNKTNLLNEAEVKFKTQLKEQENVSLKNINNEKEQVVKKQKLVIMGAISFIALLFFFGYLMYKLLSQRKKTNELLQKQKQDLERLQTLNQKIFSVISHDFKEPIANLKFLLDTKEVKENSNPVFNSFLNDFQSQLNQSNNMLDSLLDWSRLELGIKTIQSNCNISSLTNELVLNLQPKALEKSITIKVIETKQIVSSIPSQVYVICLRNILNNAIKFSPSNAKIKVVLNNGFIEISDEGKGINPEKLNDLFNKQVVSDFGTKLESGFGMGLYLCSELIQKYGGKLQAKNNESIGSTFSIYLPIPL